jgi:hypothetical protein
MPAPIVSDVIRRISSHASPAQGSTQNERTTGFEFGEEQIYRKRQFAGTQLIRLALARAIASRRLQLWIVLRSQLSATVTNFHRVRDELRQILEVVPSGGRLIECDHPSDVVIGKILRVYSNYLIEVFVRRD